MAIEQKRYDKNGYAEMLALIGSLLRHEVQFTVAYIKDETVVAYPAASLVAAKSAA